MNDVEKVIPIAAGNRMLEQVRVYWYDHTCDYISKYCEEHHQRSAYLPRLTLDLASQARSSCGREDG
jgi:hypothetical protein